jgi:hypothetical protein
VKGKGRKGEICGAVENERGKRTFAAENAIPENAYRSAMMVVPFARSSSIDLLRHTTITLSATHCKKSQGWSGRDVRAFPSVRCKE